MERIVQTALGERETQLRQEYDSMLQTQLLEQFSNFTRYVPVRSPRLRRSFAPTRPLSGE